MKQRYRTIQLTRGKKTIIDADDFDVLSKYKWYAHPQRTRTFYAVRHLNQKTLISMHREILKVNKNQIVDHVSGDGLDNRKSNLRICTIQQNCRNRQSSINSSSKYKGITWHKGIKRWISSITVNRERFYLGTFKSERKAAKAYDEEAIKRFGEFARLNFELRRVKKARKA